MDNYTGMITWKAEKRKLKDLKPFEKNPRKITKVAMEKLKDRIRQRGFHDVIKLDTNNVILSGNQRHEALTELGITEVNVLIPSRELTENERKTIVLESNRNDGIDDPDILPEFGREVLEEAGFESMEVDKIMGDDEDEEDPFDAEKVAAGIKEPESKHGDIYQLGPHTLMCGDSTSKNDVAKLMGG